MGAVETAYCLWQQRRDDDVFEVEVTGKEAEVGNVEGKESKEELSL